jgi:DNA-binding PadR family transcriptional regulator
LGFLLDISKQALGELLGKLQQRGFIEREPSAEDRRVTVIKLTETGRLAAESVDSAQTRNSRFGFLEVLNDEELARFNDYLNRMIAHLEQQLGVDSLDERRRMREDFGRRRGGHGGHGGRRPRGPGDPRHPGFFPDPFFPHGGDGGPERFEPGPGEEDR